MNTDIKNQWVTALRSGEFIQGRQRLRSDTISDDGICTSSFCCLGVLCELYDRAHPENIGYDRGRGYFLHIASIPDEVREWSELTDTLGVFYPEGNMTSLSALNDTGSTFEEIADLIDQHF